MKLTIYTKPCITEKDRIMANTTLDINLDFERMCDMLKTEFKDVVCSQKLGIVKINWKGKTILIFKSGKVSIRKAESEDDAIKTLETVSKTLKVADK